jgi:O-antigen ligase
MPLWPLLLAAPLAALAVVQPLAAVVAVVLVGLVAALRTRPVARVAAPFVALTAIAALAGPNLAVPGAPWLFLFRIMIVLLGLGTLGYLLMEGRLVASGAIGVPAALLGLMVAWSVMSLAWADDTVAALRWTLFLSMMGALALALPLAFGTRRRAIRLLIVLGAAFAVFSLISLLEIVLGVRLPTSRLAGRSADTAFAATSVFGNENNFATYLTLTLPYLLTLPIVFRDVRLRALGLVGGGAALLALLFTGSKANILATGLILIGLLLFLGTDVRQRRRVLVAAVITVLAVLLVVPALAGSGVVRLPERAVSKFSFTILQEQVEQGTGSGAVRSSLLSDGLDLLVETGGVGVGAGNAETSVRSVEENPVVANLHNWWLEVTVNLGLVGISLYVCFYLFLLTRQLRAARRTRDPLVRYLATAGGVTLVGFVAGSLGPSTMIHFAPMWITFGLAMLTIVLARRAADAGGRLP